MQLLCLWRWRRLFWARFPNSIRWWLLNCDIQMCKMPSQRDFRCWRCVCVRAIFWLWCRKTVGGGKCEDEVKTKRDENTLYVFVKGKKSIKNVLGLKFRFRRKIPCVWECFPEVFPKSITFSGFFTFPSSVYVCRIVDKRNWQTAWKWSRLQGSVQVINFLFFAFISRRE